jgi:hypothetical protein
MTRWVLVSLSFEMLRMEGRERTGLMGIVYTGW